MALYDAINGGRERAKGFCLSGNRSTAFQTLLDVMGRDPHREQSLPTADKWKKMRISCVPVGYVIQFTVIIHVFVWVNCYAMNVLLPIKHTSTN